MAIGLVFLALGFVLLVAAPPYLSFHLARRKGHRARAWAIGALVVAIISIAVGWLIGGWLVVALLVVLPTPELHPDV